MTGEPTSAARTTPIEPPQEVAPWAARPDWDPVHWGEDLQAQAAVCAGCRRCLPLCDVFPALLLATTPGEGLAPSFESPRAAVALEACFDCGRCAESCPHAPGSGSDTPVDLVGLVGKKRRIDAAATGRTRSLLADAPLRSTVARATLGVSELVLNRGLLARGLRARAGLDARATWTPPTPVPLERRLHRAGLRSDPQPTVRLVPGCVAEYHDPALAESAVAVLSAGGERVVIAAGGPPCGAESWAGGFYDQATYEAAAALAWWSQQDPGLPVVILDDRCLRFMAGPWCGLLPPAQREPARGVLARLRSFDQWLEGRPELVEKARLQAPVRFHEGCPGHGATWPSLVGDPAGDVQGDAAPNPPVLRGCCGQDGVHNQRAAAFDGCRRLGLQLLGRSEEEGGATVVTTCVHLPAFSAKEGGPTFLHPVHWIARALALAASPPTA